MTLLFAACQPPTPPLTTEPNVNLSLRPVNGDRYRSDIHSSVETAISVAGQSVETSISTDMTLSYSVLKESPQNTSINLVYEKLKVVLNNNGEKEVLDAAKGKDSFDPVEAALGNFINAVFNIVIDSNGEILNVTGGDELSKNILSTVESSDATTSKAIRDQISRLTKKAFLKEILQGANLPQMAMKVGDSWTDSASAISNIDLQAKSSFELTRLKKNTAEISVNSKLHSRPDNSKSFTQASNPVLEGVQEGYIRIDTATGIVSESQVKGSFSGTITAANREVPITIRTEKRLSSRKLE